MIRTTNHFAPKDFTKKVRVRGINVKLYDTIKSAYGQNSNKCRDYIYSDIKKFNDEFSSRKQVRFYEYQDGTIIISLKKDNHNTRFYRVP